MRLVFSMFAGLAFCVGALAADEQAMAAFAIEQIHKAKMTSCDAAARNIFANVSGDDVRVFTDVLPGDEGKAMHVTAVWGRRDDMVRVDADIRREGSRCSVNQTSTTYAETSCPMFLSRNPVWKLDSDTEGVLAAFNAGGVRALLTPIDGICVISYFRANIFEAQNSVASK